MSDRLPRGVARVRADNPSPLTLDGTNTYIVDAWVIDPGPADPSHLDEVERAAADGIEGIVVTHGHADHADGVPELERRTGVRASRIGDGQSAGPLKAVATPGHSPDHLTFLHGGIAFCGDTVLGTGSVFISPGEGSLAAYLDSLRRLRALPLEAICPGHGPVIFDPAAKLDEYIEHRLEREQRIVDALAAGARGEDELLERAWSDVDLSGMLRFGAALTLRAHLQKLSDEGRLPDGVPAELLSC